MAQKKKCEDGSCPLWRDKIEVPYSGPTKKGGVCIIGESPGISEEKAFPPRPFIGKAGQLGRRLGKEVGLPWENCFILNSARCLIDKKSLSSKEVTQVLACCRKYVVKALTALQPKLIIVLGDIALRQILRHSGVKKSRGKLVWSKEFGCWVLISVHPAYILRNPGEEGFLREDLKKAVEFIKNGNCPASQEESAITCTEVVDPREILKEGDSIGIDTEGQGLDWTDPNFVMLSYSFPSSPDQAYNVTFYRELVGEPGQMLRTSTTDFCIDWPRWGEVIKIRKTKKGDKETRSKAKVPTRVWVTRTEEFDRKVAGLRWLLENPKIKKYMHHGQYDLHAFDAFFARLGETIRVQGFVLDTQAAAHVLDENLYALSSLEQLQQFMTEFRDDYNREFGEKYDKGDMIAIPEKERTVYAGKDALATKLVAVHIKSRLLEEKRLLNYYVKMVHPTIQYALYEMEKNGAWIDTDRLPETMEAVGKSREEEFQAALTVVPKKVQAAHETKGIRFSRDDFIRDILFSEEGFKLRTVKLTDARLPSIDKDTRKTLLDGGLTQKARTFLEHYTQWSELDTLYTRYLKGFEKHIKTDGRVHSSFSLFTDTGRAACVTEDAEMLTEEGWKKKDQLRIGERVVGFDVLTGQLVMTTLQRIHSGTGRVGKLVYRHGKTRPIGIECTPEHAWVVSNGKVRGFVQAKDAPKPGVGGGLGSQFELLLSARIPAGFGTDDDVLGAQLIGWALTDGHIGITCSGKYFLEMLFVKPRKIQKFKEVVEGHIPYVEKTYPKGVIRTLGVGVGSFDPVWRKFLAFSSPTAFLVSLSPRARQAMWEVMLESDESVRRYGGGGAYLRFGNAVPPGPNKPNVGDIFSALAVLQGRALIYRQKQTTGRDPKRFIHWEISEERRKVPSYFPPTREECRVWCPETGTGTWVIRQNGVVGITGNSRSPNMMNNPKRSKSANLIRRLIAAPIGWSLLAGDEGQAELRWCAHVSGCRNMIKVFQAGEDIHIDTAKEMIDWKRASEDERKKARQKAKPQNFGLIFLLSAQGLVQYAKLDYGVTLTEQEAEEYIYKWFRRYPEVKQYHQQTIEFGRKHGYVESPLGRRRRLPELNSDQKWTRGEAERQAVNAPIQGPSSDVVLMAANELLRTGKLPSDEARLVLFVHDELVLEVREGLEEKYAKILKEALEHPPLKRDFGFELLVPLEASVSVGKNLAEMQEMEMKK